MIVVAHPSGEQKGAPRGRSGDGRLRSSGVEKHGGMVCIGPHKGWKATGGFLSLGVTWSLGWF